MSSPLIIVELIITLTSMEFQLYEQPLPLLTEEERAELDGIGHTIHRSAGDPFFLEGEPGDSALLIKKGHVKAMRGKPPRIIDVRGPGEIVGEMSVIRRKPRMASIIAFDDVEALYLPGSRWLQFLYEHPRAMHALLAMTDDMADRATKWMPLARSAEPTVSPANASNSLPLNRIAIGFERSMRPPLTRR